MIKSKHISLDEECIKKIEPFMVKHAGNFSAAIREMIELAEKAIPDNSIILIDLLFEWLLSETEGRLIPDDVLDHIIHPLITNDIGKLDKYIKSTFNKYNWKVNIDINCDNATSPLDVIIKVTGTPLRKMMIAQIASKYIIKNFVSINLGIKSVIESGKDIKVELGRVSNKQESLDSMVVHFGDFEYVNNAIKSYPLFWKCIFDKHIISNYQMVTIHKNYFEDIMAGKVPMGEIMIENIAKRPIKDIPHHEIKQLIKKVYETSKVVDKVEICNGNIILFHTYRNKEALEKLKNGLVLLLEANGHLYDAKITTNMVVLKHRPEIGIKINEIVNNLKSSESIFDQELIMFVTFLKNLRNVTDTNGTISILGKRMGEGLMEEYEKENNIKNWDLEAFRKAFMIIDSKIHRESEMKLDNKNLLYRIRKCDITMEGDNFDAYTCRAAREAFKGALNYSFGKKAGLEVKKLMSHGDTFCEVNIKLS